MKRTLVFALLVSPRWDEQPEQKIQGLMPEQIHAAFREYINPAVRLGFISRGSASTRMAARTSASATIR
jgi:hypothetical protein